MKLKKSNEYESRVVLTLLFFYLEVDDWSTKNWQARGNFQTIFIHSLKKNVTNMSQVPILMEKWLSWSYYVESSNLMERLGKRDGAEGETRTRMGLLPLDPESSEVVFANCPFLFNYLDFKDFADINNIQKSTRYTQYTE